MLKHVFSDSGFFRTSLNRLSYADNFEIINFDHPTHTYTHGKYIILFFQCHGIYIDLSWSSSDDILTLLMQCDSFKLFCLYLYANM